VLAHGTHDLPAPTTVEAEPVLVEAAGRLDPPRLRRVVAHLRTAADPDGADRQAERRHERRGLWLTPTLEGMVAVDGLLEPEAGQTVLAALEPLARPATAEDTHSGGQRRADALHELARRAWREAGCPGPVESARNWRSPSTWRACWAIPGRSAARLVGPERWRPRPVGGWPVMGW
jgi:Domain of unknown function (DUF222)